MVGEGGGGAREGLKRGRGPAEGLEGEDGVGTRGGAAENIPKEGLARETSEALWLCDPGTLGLGLAQAQPSENIVARPRPSPGPALKRIRIDPHLILTPVPIGSGLGPGPGQGSQVPGSQALRASKVSQAQKHACAAVAMLVPVTVICFCCL